MCRVPMLFLHTANFHRRWPKTEMEEECCKYRSGMIRSTKKNKNCFQEKQANSRFFNQTMQFEEVENVSQLIDQHQE